ncbi:MAG: cupin domain-containing protein [Alphaproteobacteria bacterium]|nr:cupin domain-containing protein [Alphaproteobacteria bacterium]
MKWLTPVFVLSTLCIFAQIAAHTDEATIINPHQMKWGPVAAIPGTELAVLSGDLEKAGPFVVEFRGPAGTKIPPHWHSNNERVLMISGTATVGSGDDIEPENGTMLVPGGYSVVPGKMHHWFVAQGPFVMMVEGDGPTDLHFVHPEDYPNKKTAQ